MISHYKAQMSNSIFFLLQVGLFLGPITYQMGRPERLLVFPLGLLALWWLKTLLFSYTVRVSRDGIVAESHFRRRILAWSEIERVVHKSGSFSNGYSYSEKVLLVGTTGRIKLDGNMTNYEALCGQIDLHLKRETQVSIEGARAEFRFTDVIAGPSLEDLAETVLSVAGCVLIILALLA